MGIVTLYGQIAGKQAQPVGKNVQNTRKLARGAFRRLPAEAAQGVVHVCRNGWNARNLDKPVGVVLALKSVFFQFGAFVKSIADAPVYQAFQRFLRASSAGQNIVCMPAQSLDLLLLGGIAAFDGHILLLGRVHGGHAAGGHGLNAGAVAKKVVCGVFEPPKNPLAHGLTQQVAQGGVRNGSIHIKAVTLIGQQAVDGAVIAHQIAH